MRAADSFEDSAPDREWFGELYELTGEHMILTDEGWCPGECNILCDGRGRIGGRESVRSR